MSKKIKDPDHIIGDLFLDAPKTPSPPGAQINDHPHSNPSSDNHSSLIASDANISLVTNQPMDWQISLFRRFFRGRDDAYAQLWGNQNGPKGTYGYMPACSNDRDAVFCKRPVIPCRECENRKNIPLDDSRLKSHLAGKCVIGIFPILLDSHCFFLAVDFDHEEWSADTLEFSRSCRELNVPVLIEVSRSGNGAHAWIFFDEKVPAKLARQLGTAILSHACKRSGQVKFDSYDRLFPNQDTLPAGGYGNLIALPLQGSSIKRGRTVFVDDQFQPYPDQWAHLLNVERLQGRRIKEIIFEAVGNIDPLDVAFTEEGAFPQEKKSPSSATRLIACALPKTLNIMLDDRLYFDRTLIPPQLISRLVRLASFKNDKFYVAQASHHSTWNIPRVVCCAQLTEKQVILPRGCLSEAIDLLRINNVSVQTDDHRIQGDPINVRFQGVLRDYQVPAFDALMEHDNGMLLGGTSFGKTVLCAAIIATRSTNTIVLVDTSILMEQWTQELKKFLLVGNDVVGTLKGGKDRTTGIVDVVMIQSLANSKKHLGLINRYGQVILDECDNLGAVNYEALIQTARAKFVLGLSANKKRKDGHHPKIFMQCGPIRYAGDKPKSQSHESLVKVHWHKELIPLKEKCDFNDLINHLIMDVERNDALIKVILDAYAQGRKILVLTARIKHMEDLQKALAGKVKHLMIVRGSLTRKKDKEASSESMSALLDLPFDTPRVIIATGRKGGKGFSHDPLDTLVLATPISGEDDVKQYSGRIDRTLDSQTDTWIIDIADTGHASTNKMWKKRRSAYNKFNFRIQYPEDQPTLF